MKTATRILLAISIILLSTNAFSATYYVSTSGDDRNSGTSPDAPWANCPGLIGWGGSKTLSAGDTVYFRSEDTWDKTSGSQINEFFKLTPGVKYYGDSWGTGTRAKIRLTGGSLYNGIVGWESDHATVPSWFQGFEIDGNDVNYGDGGGFFFGGYDQSSDMNGAKKTVKNCVIHHLNHSGWTYGVWFRPWNSHMVSNVDILNVTVYNTGSDLIALYPNSSDTYIDTILVRGCESYNGGLINQGTGASILLKNDVRNATCEFNYLHDSPQGITFESTSINSQTNAIIRYNIQKGTTGMPGIYFQGGYTGSRSVEIYGNLILNNADDGIRVKAPYMGTSDSIKIYNNTCYNNTRYELQIGSTGFTHTYDVRNNILYSISSQPLSENTNAITTHNNNLYYRVGGGALLTNGGSSYTASNITSFESTAIATNPSFKNTSILPTGFAGTYGTDMRPNSDGLSVESGDALDHGDGTLSSTYNKAINTAGYASPSTRPQGAGWDIGAYEYSGIP